MGPSVFYHRGVVCLTESQKPTLHRMKRIWNSNLCLNVLRIVGHSNHASYGRPPPDLLCSWCVDCFGCGFRDALDLDMRTHVANVTL